MKNVIVLCAILPFTIAIIVLIGYMTINSQNENFVIETVYKEAQQAGRDGYFTASNVEKIKTDIATRLSVKKEDIKITVDNTVKYRPEIINYKIEVPIDKVVPANKLFGIKDKDNKGKIVINDKVMSERLAP